MTTVVSNVLYILRDQTDFGFLLSLSWFFIFIFFRSTDVKLYFPIPLSFFFSLFENNLSFQYLTRSLVKNFKYMFFMFNVYLLGSVLGTLLIIIIRS